MVSPDLTDGAQRHIEHIKWMQRAFIQTSLKEREIRNPGGSVFLMPFINTSAVVLRCKKWLEDPDVRKFLRPNTPMNPFKPEEKWTYEEFVAYRTQYSNSAYFQIFDRKSDYGAIGLASYNGIDYDKLTFERGIVIGEKSLWRQGIGAEVGRLLLQRAAELGFITAKATANVLNNASIRNLTNQMGQGIERNGMVYFELDLAPQISPAWAEALEISKVNS